MLLSVAQGGEEGDEYPSEVKWIKSMGTGNHSIIPENLVTEDEVKIKSESCPNPLDPALILLIYETGGRIGEVLSPTAGAVSFDKYGAVLTVARSVDLTGRDMADNPILVQFSSCCFPLVYFHSPIHLIRYTIVTTVMSPNKKLIETYMACTDRSKVAPLLTDDAEWVEWGDGVPASGVRSRGKVAFLENYGDQELLTQITRMMEENNVVVAEGTVRVPKKEGGFLMFRFCDIFELENGKVKRLTSFAAEIKNSA